MNFSNTKHMHSQRGFTIVELLIVIVVIGILAAIVIVAYNGVTARANNTDAAAAATTVDKKAEAYYADPLGGNGSYPTTFAVLSGAASTATYTLAGSGVTLATTAITAKPATAKTINFYQCGTTVGNFIAFWNYTSGALNYYYTGGAQGTGANAGTLTSVPGTGSGVTCSIATS